MILIFLNACILSAILYLNGYRLSKTFFYKKDLITFETDTYEIIYESTKLSLIKFDDIYKFYNFKSFPLIKIDDPYLKEPFMFNYLFDVTGNIPHFQYPHNKFVKEKDTQYDYRYLNDHTLLVQTKYHNLEYKHYNLLDRSTHDIEYESIKIDDDLYLYTFETTETPENFTLEAYVNHKRITSDSSIYKDTYYDIEFENTKVKERTFYNPFELIPFQFKVFENFNPNNVNIILRYSTKSINYYTEEVNEFTTIFLEYDNNIYWTDAVAEEYTDLYLVNTDDFNQAFRELKRVLK